MSDHPALLEAVQRALALDELSWLRATRVENEAGPLLARLLGGQGSELLESALRDGRYLPAELPLVARQLADVARTGELREVRGWLREVLQARLPFGHGGELPSELIGRVLKPVGHEAEPGAALRALAEALAPHARKLIELRERAEQAFSSQLTAARRSLRLPALPCENTERGPSAAEPEAARALAVDALEQLLRTLAVGRGTATDPRSIAAEAHEYALRKLTGERGPQVDPRAVAAEAQEYAVRKLTAAGRGSSAAEIQEYAVRKLAAERGSAADGAAEGRVVLALQDQAPGAITLLDGGADARVIAALNSPGDMAALVRELGAPGAEAPLPELTTLQWCERAQHFLEHTDDAAGELTRWWMKRAAGGGRSPDDVGQLMAALRAPELDGLAKPQKRFFRVAAGARQLGFEADMSARLRAEPGKPLLAPLVRTFALAVPGDVRVSQPGLEFGIASDLVAAQGTGEALAMCLVSPGLSLASRRAPEASDSVSAAFGGLFLQLRAEPGYLRRVDELDRDQAEPAARHAALWTLLRARLAAALLLVEQTPLRDPQQRLQQLMAASERALGRPLPEGVAALWLLSARPNSHEFAALARGYELHAALRERFDLDFYLNPRVSEVLRGAAARGGAFSAEGLARELGVDPAAGRARAIELLG